MTLSQEILNYRARERLTQQELADKVGVDRTTLLNAENGRYVSRLTEAKIRLVIDGGD